MLITERRSLLDITWWRLTSAGSRWSTQAEIIWGSNCHEIWNLWSESRQWRAIWSVSDVKRHWIHAIDCYILRRKHWRMIFRKSDFKTSHLIKFQKTFISVHKHGGGPKPPPIHWTEHAKAWNWQKYPSSGEDLGMDDSRFGHDPFQTFEID